MHDDSIQLNDLPVQRRQLRLAIVTETYPPEINGVAMTIGHFVRGLQARDHHVQLVRPRQSRTDTPQHAEFLEELLATGVPIPRYNGLKFGLPAKQALLRAWTLKRPDLVHIVTEGPLGWSALAIALKLKIPATSDFHTNFHSYTKHYGVGWLKKPIHAYLRKFHNRTLATFVPTQAMAAELAGAGYKNLEVVSRGVETSLFRPQRRSQELRREWGVGATDPVVVYVGRIAAEKNLPVLIRAFQAMRQANPAFKLVLVGDGPERASLQARHPDFVFAGMRVGEDLARHYASGDVFLFPSITETYGNVTMEALASGLAVLAYDYAAAREHIRHDSNGLVASPGNEAEFIRESLRLTDPVLVARLRQAAAQIAARQSWNHVFQSFEHRLLNIIDQRERDNV